MKCAYYMKICFKMREITEFNFPWNFQPKQTYFDNINRNIKKNFLSLVFTNMFLLPLWNLEITIFCQIKQKFLCTFLVMNFTTDRVKKENMRTQLLINQTETMSQSYNLPVTLSQNDAVKLLSILFSFFFLSFFLHHNNIKHYFLHYLIH